MARSIAATEPVHGPALRRPGRLSVWRWLAPFLLVALALRLVPLAAGGQAGDAAGSDPAQGGIGRIEQPGETFTGSAWFFAEDAFDPMPGAANGLDQRWRGNRHILAIDIGPAAPSVRFTGRTALDRVRALTCLTSAIYYEAGNEPEEGQRAVAQVVLNRLRHPDWPDSVCGVVYEGTERADLRCQFTFSCDGSMARRPGGERWSRARRIAEAALRGEVFAPVGLATYYHTLTVFPAWASRMRPAAIIGAHIFYRGPGDDGAPMRFTDRYGGVETVAGPGLHAYVDPRAEPAPPVASVAAVAAVTAAWPDRPARATAGAGVTQAPAAPGLPQSGDVKPQWRNSGRPIAGR
jgi:spore germination cell wall hydrolase CwlJ-like protein